MPKKRSTGRAMSTGKTASRPARHLHVVPDDAQTALWDSAELERLARLRQLAIATGAPADAIRLIDSAVTADDAIATLTAAGLMPTQAESDERLLAWFAPLLKRGCQQLDAELCGTSFIGELRGATPSNLDVEDVLGDIVERFASHRSAEALAMMRALTAVLPVALQPLAANAAARMVHDGVTELPWVTGLGWPEPGRCFGYTDIYGEQRSMVMTFRYGHKTHAVVVLIDHVLGGGIKDCYVVDYAESIRAEYRRIGRDPDIIFADLDPAEARAILVQALTCEPCPVEPDQVDDVERYLDLVRARADALAGTALNAGPAVAPTAVTAAADRRPARKRSPGPRNIHRLKLTLRGTKPPIWRRVEVPSDITLQRLHRVIQAGFGWEDYHLHLFETAVGRYGIPDPDGDDTGTLNDAYKKLSGAADWPGDRIRYTYDFGDNWELDIVVEAVLPAEPGAAYPRYTGGRRAGPPEDSGGVWGYAEMLSVLANPAHKQHEARLGWLGITAADEYDAEAFDAYVVNLDLRRRVLIKL